MTLKQVIIWYSKVYLKKAQCDKKVQEVMKVAAKILKKEPTV